MINTINAYSYAMAQKDVDFARALKSSDVLIPDGISIVFAKRILNGERIKKIAGATLFYYEMERLNQMNGKCFFLGSSENTLDQIKAKASMQFPNVEVSVYSPPFKKEFTAEENQTMLKEIGTVKPDVLFIGMTAPKQEKWAHSFIGQMEVGHVCSIGAVFDFYAGNIKRAPDWMIHLGMEWFYRLIREPGRLWKRYLIGNAKFILYIIAELFSGRGRRNQKK